MSQPEAASVIVVDDNVEDAEAVAMALMEDGYAVRVAHSAADCMDLIADQKPECVILDFHMPETDGLDLVLSLRAKFGDDVVLIAITGVTTENPRVKETLARVDHHFMKPIFREQFHKLLPPVNHA